MLLHDPYNADDCIDVDEDFDEDGELCILTMGKYRDDPLTLTRHTAGLLRDHLNNLLELR